MVRGRRLPKLFWPVVGAVMGSVSLAALYFAIVTLAESLTHALDLMREDSAIVIPMVLGFGIQVGLYVYLRQIVRLRRLTRAAGALTGTGGGTSTLAMVACCAHHVADFLPLVGLSAAAVFLVEYKTWFVVVGMATNVIGILVMLRVVWRQRRSGAALTQG